MKTDRVLIVDDNEDNRYLLRTLLQGNGFEVATATQGVEALEVARQNPPDLVIADILMPVMDGFALCQAWKKDERLRQIPFVFYTATYTDERDREFGLSLGAERFIVKPEEPRAFMAIIREVLQQVQRPPARVPTQAPPQEEASYLKQYNEALIRKLEAKMGQLEQAKRALEQDIAGRQRAEEGLRISEERLRLVLDGLGPHMFVGLLDLEGVVLVVNQPALAAAGLRLADVLGRPFADTHWFAYSESASQRLRAAITRAAQGETVRYDEEIQVAGEQVIWVDFCIQPLRDETGRITFLVPSARVITERKRAEEALRNSEEQFRQLAENIHEVFFVCAQDPARLTYLSPAYEEVWGRPRQEVYDRTDAWIETVHPEDRKLAIRIFTQAFQGEQIDAEYRVVQPSGPIRWVRARVFPVRDAKGSFCRVVGFVEDITERKRVEAASQAAEQQLADIIEFLPDATFVIDQDKRVIAWNRACEVLTGVKKEALLGQGDYAYAEPFYGERRPVLIDLVNLPSPEVETTYRYVQRKGSMIYAEVFAPRLRDGQGAHLWGVASPLFDRESRCCGAIEVVRDVTESKQAEEAVREAQYLLSEVGRIAKIGGWKMDLITRKATWTESMYDIAEIAPGEPIPGPDEHVDYYLPEYQPLVAEAMRALIEDDKPLDFEAQLRTAKGNVKWCRAMGRVVRKGGKAIEVYGTFQDITERKRAEEARSYLASIVESSDDAIIGKSLDGIIVSWNAGAERVYGYSAAEVVGHSINALVPSDRLDETSQIIEKLKRGEGVDRFETVRMKKDGELVDVSLTVSPIRDAAGNTVSAATIARDITERKRAEEALRLASAYNRSLIQTSLDPLVTISLEGKITDANRATENVTGLEREQLIGTEFSDYFDDPDRARAGYRRVLLEGQVHDYELTIRHRDGHTTPVLYNASVYRGLKGEVAGIFAAARDITEQKRAAEALRRASTYNRNLIEASLDPLVTINPEGRITDVNHATEEVTGRSKAELVDMDFAEFFTEPEEARRGYQQVFREGSVQDYELAIRHRDGHVIPVMYNASLYRDEAGNVGGVFAAARDISERKRSEAELAERLRFERLLAEISGRFVRVPAELLNAEIEVAQRRVCESLGLEVCTLWQISETAPGFITLTHQHRPAEESPPPERLSPQQDFPWCFQQVLAGKVVAVSSVEELPPEAARDQDSWRQFGVKANLTIGLAIGGGPIIGALSFNTMKAGRTWPEPLVKRLQLVAELFSNALSRQRTEKALRESEERFRSLVENATVGIYRTTPDGRILMANPALVKMMGYGSFQELAPRNLEEEGFPPDYSRSEFKARLDREGQSAGLEESWLRRDGTTIFVRESARAIRGKDGRVMFYDGIVEDITKGKQAEESRRYLASIVESSDDAIFGKDLDGVIQSWNSGAEKLYGYTAAEMIGQPVHLLAPPDSLDEITDFLARIRRGEQIEHYETARVRKGGARIDISITISPIKNACGRVVGASSVARDITAQKQAEAALRRSDQRNAVLNRIANIFLTIPDEQVYGEVLTVVIEVLKSQFGVYGYIDDNGTLVIPSLTGGIWDNCQVPDKSIVFPQETWGDSLWGKAAGERKACYSAGPFHTPEGHVRVDSFLTVPVVFGDKTIGLLSVANKEGGYTEEDKDLLESIAANISPILNARLEREKEERERQRAEALLARERDLLHALMDNIPEKIFFKDTENHFVRINRAHAESLRLADPAGAEGKTDFDFHSREMAEEAHRDEKRIVETGEPLLGKIEKIDDGGGKARWNLVTKVPIKDQQGQVVGLVGISRDITERMRAEEELRFRNAILSTQQETSPDGILVVDENGRILSFNQRFVEMWGVPAEAIQSGLDERALQSSMTMVRDPEQFRKRVDDLYRNRHEISHEEIALKDGRTFDRHSAAMFGAEGKYYGRVWYFRDITERKQAEAQVAERTRLATLIGEVGTALGWAETLREGLEQCTQALVRNLGLAFARVWTLNESEKMLELQVSAGMYTHTDGPHGRLPLGEFKIGRIAASGEPHLTNMVAEDSFSGDKDWARREGMVAFAGYPLMVEGRVAGVVAGFAREHLSRAVMQAFASVADATAQFINRKRAEEALRESEEKYRSLVSNVPDVVWTMNAENRFTFISKNIEKISGFSVDEIYQQGINPYLTSLHPDDLPKVAEGVRALFAEGRPFDVEVRVKRKEEEEWKWIHDRALATYEKNGIRYADGLLSDITARRRAEEALRESEEKYRVLYESSRDAIMLLTPPEWKFTAVNSAAIALFGVRDEREFMSVDPWGLSPEYQPDGALSSVKARQMIDLAMERGSLLFEWTHKKFSGEGFFATVMLTRMFYRGQPFLQATVRDITERKRAEALLARERDLLHALMDNIPEKIFFKDTENHFVRINRAHAESLRLADPAGAEGKTDFDFHSREMAEEAYRDEKRIVETGEPLLGKIEKIDDGGGKARWNLVTKVPIKDQQGQVVGLVGISRDITQMRRAEEMLRLSEQRFSKAFNASPDPIIIATLREGICIDVNESFSRATGYQRDEVIGRNALEVGFCGRDADLAKMLRVLEREGLVRDFEMTFVTKSGQKRKALLSSETIQVDGQRSLLVVFKDITERLQLEAQCRQAQKMEAVGRLAGGVAHDFNNLLTIINGHSALMLKQLPPDNPARESFADIKDAGERAAGLTRQLLAFSRQQVLTSTILDLNALVSSSAKMLRRLIGEDIELAFDPAPEVKKVSADAGQIEQVLMNLAVNSRDAMPRGGKLTIEVSNFRADEGYAAGHFPMPPGSYVMLAVSDTGCGMDAATRARAFEPFFTTKEQGKGTGLGLATVYGIVKQNGGYIWVYSELGYGTTFKIYLPVVEGTAQAREARGGTGGGSETVLLVEDEVRVRSLARRMLESEGYKVLEVPGGMEALLMASQHKGPIHLLLTDVVMPLMSGRELAERLAKQRPEMKILYMSGYTDDTVVRHGVLESGVAFLQKPFAPEVLARKVREVLDVQNVR
jgi:PAS domain S-box-containing protein